jgi:hypothetical protein
LMDSQAKPLSEDHPVLDFVIVSGRTHLHAILPYAAGLATEFLFLALRANTV